MLHGRGIFDEPGLLWSAAGVVFIHGYRQRLGQEPERNRGHESDGAGDEVAQPPCPHPAGITGRDGHSLCQEKRSDLNVITNE